MVPVGETVLKIVAVWDPGEVPPCEEGEPVQIVSVPQKVCRWRPPWGLVLSCDKESRHRAL